MLKRKASLFMRALCIMVVMIFTVGITAPTASALIPQQLSIEYNREAGLIHGIGEKGIFGTGFEIFADDFLVRTTSDTWAKCFGYNIFYDYLSPCVLVFVDTLRFPFAYDGRDWMIQIWKGSYVVFFNGAEIGLYEKPSGRPVFWDASETMLEMSMRLYQGENLFFDYPPYTTWWACGFRMGSTCPALPASQLRLTGSILFEDPGYARCLSRLLRGQQTNEHDGAYRRTAIRI